MLGEFSEYSSVGLQIDNPFSGCSAYEMEVREIRTANEKESAFVVLKELRSHLTFDEFIGLYEAARKADHYTLLAAYEEDSIVGLMGYRVLSDFVHGKHLYIDDLVITENKRSQGLGAQLLTHAEGLAKDLGCRGLRLCTGVENEAGKKFYERHGWTPRALAFKKSF